jgi:hypothetical protein
MRGGRSPAASSGLRFGICELCYHGATPDEIAGCELTLDEANALEAELVAALEKTGQKGNTIVAFALAGQTVGNR